MMAVVVVEAYMAEAVGVIQISGGEDHMQEWCSEIMAHR